MRLAWRIALRKNYFGLYSELCRIFCIPFPFMTRRGQGVKTHSIILKTARRGGLFLVNSFSDAEKKALCADFTEKCVRYHSARRSMTFLA